MAKARLRYIFNDDADNPVQAAFGRGKGRMYGNWIDSVLGSARSNGHNAGDLIEEPGGIIESLLRDEVFTERDLTVGTTASRNVMDVPALQSSVDDYYNYSGIINVTRDDRDYIVDYTGSSKQIEISGSGVAYGAADKIYLSNIQGDYKIDSASFDAIGNTTNGKRKDWKFARSLNSKTPVETIINDLLYESHSILFESADEDNGYSKLKIKALDKITGASEFGTWVKPMTSRGVPQAPWSLTPLDNLFTSFRLFYAYDYGKGDYQKSILVDKNGYSNPSGGTTLTDEHLNLCKFAEKTYRISREFAYSSNWIYDDATAEFFLDKKIRWHTEQRLKVNWLSPLNSTDQGSIAYEIGDQGFLSYTLGLPAGYEYQGTTAASHKFMITAKNIVTNPEGVPFIKFQLIDLGI